MASSVKLGIFRSVAETAVRDAVIDGLLQLNYTLSREDGGTVYIKANRRSVAVRIASPRLDAFELFAQLPVELRRRWMYLRTNEDIAWGYRMFSGDNEVDRFSTRPQELEGDWHGRPLLVSELFQVSVGKISNYYVNWDGEDEPSRPRAYWFDRATYFDGYQIYDFVRRLSGMKFRSNDRGIEFGAVV